MAALPWDGSDLGCFPAAVLVKEFRYQGVLYWRLQLEGYESVFAEATLLRTTLPCVVDELKRVFSLTRTGTHRIKIEGRSSYLLYRAESLEIGDGEMVVREMLLAETPQEKTLDYRRYIQSIFGFRALLGLTPTNEKVISFRNPKRISRKTGEVTHSYYYEVLSRQETPLRSERNPRATLSASVLSRWFNDISVADTICLMTSFSGTAEDLRIIASQIRFRCEEVIRRVDPKFIWLSNVIYERLLSYYLTNMDMPPEEKPWNDKDFQVT